MKLYEYDLLYEQAVQANIDPETGEVDIDGLTKALDALEQERAAKIKNIVAYYKDLKSDSDALKAEAKALTDRAKSAEKKADSLKGYLAKSLKWEPYKDGVVDIRFRNNEVVDIDESILPKKYFRIKKEPDKQTVKALLKEGKKIKGAKLVNNRSMQVK